MGKSNSKPQTPDDGTSNKDNEPEDKTPEMMRVFVIIVRVIALITTPGEVKQEPRLLQEEIRTVREFLEQLLEQVKRLESGPNSSPDSNSKKSDATDSSRFEDNEVQEQILGKGYGVLKRYDSSPNCNLEPLTLSFYYPEENTVYRNLLEELKRKIRPDKCDVYWEKCKEPEGRSDTPLLVLCINISRIGVDIDNALRYVNRGRFIILLIAHMREAHVLPSNETTREKQHDHVKHVIEVAYTTEKGLYYCEKNKRAKETLEMILHSMKQA